MNIYIRMEDGREIIGMEDVEILSGGWRHFTGETNNRGELVHHFNIKVDTEDNVNKLRNFGFNVKLYTPENGEPFYHLDVSISWRYSSPEVHLYYRGNDTELDESTIGSLDRKSIAKADIEVTKSRWTYLNNTGIKPYCIKLYALSEDGPLANKWASYQASWQQPEPVQAQFPEMAAMEEDIPF